MLKNLCEAANPTGVNDASDNTKRGASAERNRRAADIRRNINPADLEKELRVNMHNALRAVDNLTDILAVMATKTKDEFEEAVSDAQFSNDRIPEYVNRPASRSFGLYWRRVTRISNNNVFSTRISIRDNAKSGDGEEGTGYSKRVFFTNNSELKELRIRTEEQFTEIRTILAGVMTLRKTLALMDRHATLFFDKAVLYDADQRIRSSALDDAWPFRDPPESEYFVKIGSSDDSSKREK